MSTAVAPKTVKAYARDGVTVMRDIVDAATLDELREAVERDIADPGPFFHGYKPEDGQGQFHGNLRIWQHDSVFGDFCLNSGLPELARQFFGGGRVNLLYDQLFVKEPGTVNRTRWHNDQPYWPVSGSHVISFWIALDDVEQDSGALEFVRGSNHWDRWFQPRQFGETQSRQYDDNPDYEEIPDIQAARDDYDIVSWDLKAGDCYVFNGMTVHGAGGNRSANKRRRGYTVRYTGKDARYDLRVGTSQPLHNVALSDGDLLDSEIYPLIISD